MTLIHGTIDVFIYTSLAISAPSVALWLRSRKPPTIPIPRPPLRTALTVLVVLHTLYTLYTLIYHQPPNIFTSLDIPISTPTAHIRTVFLEHAAHDPTMTLSPSLDALITRLNSFDVRTVFIRFGQQTVESCDYCHSLEDFAMIAFPRPLLEYVREAFIVGLLTTRGSGHEGRRSIAIALLISIAIGEAYWLYTVPISLRENSDIVFMWHDLLWILRHILFLTLLPVLHLLPTNASSPPLSVSLRVASTTIEMAHARTRLLRYTRGAALRDPNLRGRALVYWKNEKRVGDWVRGDEAVRKAADEMKLGFREKGEASADEPEKQAEQDGTLRDAAKRVIVQLREVFKAEP